MKTKVFQIDSIKYITDEKYREKFKSIFKKELKRFYEIKYSIQKIIDNDFKIEFLARPEHHRILHYIIDRNNDDKQNIVTYFFLLDDSAKLVKKDIRCIFVKRNKKWWLKNKSEVRKKFYEVLISNERDILFNEIYIERTEMFYNLLLDNREMLKGIPESSIYNIQKIFFEYTCNIVKQSPDLFHFLFPFKKYIFTNEKLQDLETLEYVNLNSDVDFYKFIAAKTLNEKSWTAVKMKYHDHNKKNIIPKL